MSNPTFMRLLLPLCAVVFLMSCKTQSYYVSPVYGSNHYVSQPLQNSEEKSAVYAHAAFTGGQANQYLNDDHYSFQGNIYNVHQFSVFKGWYGAGLNLGNYHVAPSYLLVTNNGQKNIDGNKFFGAGNLEGGMNVVLPFKHVEWRVLGISGNLYNEFGKYSNFRSSLNKDSVSGVATSRTLGTLGFSTEVVRKLHNGTVGWQIQYNMMLGQQYSDMNFGKVPPEYNKERYAYLTNTVQLTLDNLTYYVQLGVGVRLINAQFGVNYKIFSQNKK